MILRPVAAAVMASVALSPFAASAAFATTYVPLPLAYRVKHAEVIVVGSAAGLDLPGDRHRVFEIAVREVLKGTVGRRLSVVAFYAMGEAPFWAEADDKGRLVGVFFLVRDQDGGFRPLGLPSFAPMSERGRVSTLLRMLADLKTFVDDPRIYDDADLVTYVGEAFTTPSVRCDDAWRIGESAANAWLREPDAPRSLWQVKTTWSVRLRYDRRKTPPVTVIDAGLDPEVVAAIGSETNRASRHPYTGDLVFETLDLFCQIDARWPQAVGRLKAADAVRYVRGRLRSADPRVVTSALFALGAMHDGEALRVVTPLLRNRDPKVVATRRAVSPMGRRPCRPSSDHECS